MLIGYGLPLINIIYNCSLNERLFFHIFYQLIICLTELL